MTDRELMQMALDALEWCYDVTEWPANGESAQDKAIEALRARLAQPEPEPVAWLYEGSDVAGRDVCLAEDIFEEQKPNCIPLYTAPPQREWKGLTDEERTQIWDGIIKYIAGEIRINDFAKAIEAKLKEKNG